jgi:hypothetical protein
MRAQEGTPMANFCPPCGAPLQAGSGFCADRGQGACPAKDLSAKERLARAGEPTGAATAAIVIGIVGLVLGVIGAIGVLTSM